MRYVLLFVFAGALIGLRPDLIAPLLWLSFGLFIVLLLIVLHNDYPIVAKSIAALLALSTIFVFAGGL